MALAFIVQRVAYVPIAGITLGCAGAAVGTFSVTRNVTWLAIGRSDWEKDTTNHRVGIGAGFASGSLLVAVRELALLPEVASMPHLPSGASIPQMMRHALATTAHAVTHFPYRFRLVSVFSAGAVAGLVSVLAQKWYAEQSSKAKVLALRNTSKASSEQRAELSQSGARAPAVPVVAAPPKPDVPRLRADAAEEASALYDGAESSGNFRVVSMPKAADTVELAEARDLWLQEPQAGDSDAKRTFTATGEPDADAVLNDNGLYSYKIDVEVPEHSGFVDDDTADGKDDTTRP